VRSIYAAWGRGDWSSAEWAHPQIEYVLADGPTPGTWIGLAGMSEGWGEWLRAWAHLRCEADEYRVLDDERVLVLAHFAGRGRASGLEIGEISSPGAGGCASLWHIRDGQVWRLVNYWERDGALADLGLAPEGNEAST
jgi:hypothetical protein